jgi:RNA polymerase sigma-70 factor (ECF subfamily)
VTTTEQNSCFDAWLREHAAMLHHVTNGFADGADRHDLMQELLVALWHAIPAFRGGSRVSTFIYRVAHNAALTWKRTQRNYRRRLLPRKRDLETLLASYSAAEKVSSTG